MLQASMKEVELLPMILVDNHAWEQVPICRGRLSGSHGPFQAPRILANLMNCPKSTFRAASIMLRTDDSSRSGCLLTYELDFCIHWLECLPGSQ